MLENTCRESVGTIIDRIVEACQAPHSDTHNGQAGLILGPGGIGKSAAAYAAARQLSEVTGQPWNVVDIRVLLYDPVELKGLQGLPDDGSDFTKLFSPDWARGLDIDGNYILLFDEMTKALPSVLNSLYQGILDRAFAGFRFGRNWVPMATGNLATDKAGDVSIPSPLRDRFWITIADPDLRGWMHWASANNVRPEVISYLQRTPDHFMSWDGSEDPLCFASARSWHSLSKFAEASKDPAGTLCRWAIPYLGEKIGLSFSAHVEVVTKLVDPQQVFDDPMNAPLMENAALGFYASQMLAYWVEPENFGALVAYARRNPNEVAMAMVNDAITRKPELMATADYIAFISEYDPQQRA